MQIVIPMSGFGERFRVAGYMVPKPLIEVDGKPIIEHVVSLFPGENEFFFVCNEDHLTDPKFKMREILERIAPRGTIVPIPAHRRGPVHAVQAARSLLDPGAPVVVNYADFFCLWNWTEFVQEVTSSQLDCSVPAYRGFHPHSGGSTNYAYVREKDGVVSEVREKQPFTLEKTKEFASTGTYYFSSAALMFEAFEAIIRDDVSVGGEYYVSSACDYLAKSGKRVGVHEVFHFMQWGTPADLQEYEWWSGQFLNISENSATFRQPWPVVVPASGEGSRFAIQGYEVRKPLLPLNGTSMLESVVTWAGGHDSGVYVALPAEVSDLKAFPANWNILYLDRLTDGQASTTNLIVSEYGQSISGPFLVLPSDTLVLVTDALLSRIEAQLDAGSSLISILSSESPGGKTNPDQFGWIALDRDGAVLGASIKAGPKQPSLQITGAFVFASTQDFERLYRALVDSDESVNGEFYLDSLVSVAMKLGVRTSGVRADTCISVGTPLEYESFRYWQTAFTKWPGHPYSAEADVLVKGDL